MKYSVIAMSAVAFGPWMSKRFKSLPKARRCAEKTALSPGFDFIDIVDLSGRTVHRFQKESDGSWTCTVLGCSPVFVRNFFKQETP